MAHTRVISIIGRKDAGKTTLVVALAREFKRRGRRVATLKHGHHPALVDTEGKDTWRHRHEGGADKVMIESPGERVLFERTDQEADPRELIRTFLSDADIVIVEGFKSYPLPKIEVHRVAVHPAPLYEPTRTDASLWVGMVTDDPSLRTPFPRFVFSDTSWLTTLGHLAWDRGMRDEP